MNKQIVEHVVKKTLSETKLKNGKPALSLYGEHTHLHINPSGKSPQRKLILIRGGVYNNFTLKLAFFRST